jgi:hypothetical protein
VVSFTPQLLYPQGKRHWYPLDRRLFHLRVSTVSYLLTKGSQDIMVSEIENFTSILF